jgi:hypothetical protein
MRDSSKTIIPIKIFMCVLAGTKIVPAFFKEKLACLSQIKLYRRSIVDSKTNNVFKMLQIV